MVSQLDLLSICCALYALSLIWDFSMHSPGYGNDDCIDMFQLCFAVNCITTIIGTLNILYGPLGSYKHALMLRILSPPFNICLFQSQSAGPAVGWSSLGCDCCLPFSQLFSFLNFPCLFSSHKHNINFWPPPLKILPISHLWQCDLEREKAILLR